MERLLKSFLIFIVAFSLSAQLTFANADELIIQDDGGVILIITNNVLAEKTSKESEKKEEQKPKPPPTAAHPVRTVPIAPPRSESTIKIEPPINNNKKIQVTVTTPAPLKPSFQAPSVLKPQTTNQVPAAVVTKIVDQVVAKGREGQPVFTIKSEKARELTIQQETTKVQTPLPLQIDTVSHALSVTATNESTRVSVLPKEAVAGAVGKGLVDEKKLGEIKITLTKDASGVNYSLQSEKTGKLFGVFDVKGTDEVKLSAQTGKVVGTSKSPLFNILGGFIK